jgi:DinB family protein
VPIDRKYVTENDTERERLRKLVARMSDEELSRPMPGGWTVSAVLAHIAFWDARAIFYLDKWARGAEPGSADYDPEDVGRVNDSAKPLCLALPPRDAAKLALRLAEEADRKVKALSDEILAKIRAAGRSAPPNLQDPNGAPFNLARAGHRREHLDDIEHEHRA